MVQRHAGSVTTAQHARNFLNPTWAVKFNNARHRTPVLRPFFNRELDVAMHGHLGQMRNAEDLAPVGHLGQFLARRRARPGADSGCR